MSELPNDPWVVQAPRQSASVPVGAYMADYSGTEDFTMTDGKVKWRWKWKVKTGPEVGNEASSLTDKDIRPKTLPGTLIEGLLGRSMQVGENVKAALDARIGKTYLVNVQPGPRGVRRSQVPCPWRAWQHSTHALTDQ